MDTSKHTAASDSSTRRKQSKLVQVVQNFFTKTSQVIVQARSAADTKPSQYGGGTPENPAESGGGAVSEPAASTSKINKWFNLHLPSLDAEWARQELRPWKLHTAHSTQQTAGQNPGQNPAHSADSDLSHFPPMIIETYLDLRQLSACEMVVLEDDHGGSWPVAEGSSSRKSEVVLERWLIEFDRTACSATAPSGASSASGAAPKPAEELPHVYKQAIVLLRVIYGIVRLLPAYKARKIVARPGNKNLALRNRFIDGKQPVNSKGRIGLSKSIVPHQMLLTDSHMTSREFAPIPTSLGTLRVSVAYRNHYKFRAQDQEERLSSHFIFTDSERAKGSPVADATADIGPTHAVRTAETAQEHESSDLVVGGDTEGSERSGTETTSQESVPVVSTPAADMPAKAQSNPHRGSFGQFRERYSVSPCTSVLQDKTVRRHGSAAHSHLQSHGPVQNAAQNAAQTPAHSQNPRPSIQPFKVGSIGSSSSPPYGTLNSVHTSGGSASMERRISITSNRSGSNASLVALLRNPRGSASSSNTPNTGTGLNPQTANPSLPRSIASSHDDHESTPNTPRFSSSFGSRQSRRFSNTSQRYAVGSHTDSNAYLGTSADSTSSVPFSGLYADDDISSFVQMIDGTSELRLTNSNHESKESRLALPHNDSSTHIEALNRFQLLKSHYQHLSDSVNASLVLQQHRSRSESQEKLPTRRSSRSSRSPASPAASLPIGSYENSHLPSITSRLSKLGDEMSPSSLDSKSGSRVGYSPSPVPNLLALPSTVTTIAHATTGIVSGSQPVVSGLATTPSVYDAARPDIKYAAVFDEDDEGIDYFAASRAAKAPGTEMSFDNDDLLFEMTDTK